ncbi:methyl-accepting protein IV [compost metagenome]
MTQMDQATQQNAALVEEMAAAASSLTTQAVDLVNVVSAFKINASEVEVRNEAPPRYQVPMARPVQRLAFQ